MKALNLLLLGLLLAVVGHAQSSPETLAPPGLTVLQMRWHKAVFVPALYDDPMRANQQQDDLKREQDIINKQNKIRVNQGQAPLAVPNREVVSSKQEPLPGRSVNYIYEARIKNTSQKTIRKVVWQYSFVDPQTGEEIDKHTYIQKLSLRPGKTGNLTGISTTPPTGVIEVTKKDQVRSKYEERVTISRLEYDDGSFWQRPLN